MMLVCGVACVNFSISTLPQSMIHLKGQLLFRWQLEDSVCGSFRLNLEQRHDARSRRHARWSVPKFLWEDELGVVNHIPQGEKRRPPDAPPLQFGATGVNTCSLFTTTSMTAQPD